MINNLDIVEERIDYLDRRIESLELDRLQEDDELIKETTGHLIDMLKGQRASLEKYLDGFIKRS